MVLKAATRKDVAERAGVSVATVSYVINNSPRTITEETRQRVLQAVEALNYRPHAAARSLKTGRSGAIGLLVPSLISPFMANLVYEVERHLARHGLWLVVASSHEDCGREMQMLDILAAQGMDGLLYIPSSCTPRRQVEDLLERSLPLVFVDRFIPGVPADVVTTDNREAARLATEYLIGQGGERFICLSFSGEASSAVERMEGFAQALANHHLTGPANRSLIVQYIQGETVEQHLEEYATRYGHPHGVLITSDLFFPTTIKALKQAGLRIPEQVRLSGGFFASPFNDVLDRPMHIVSQDIDTLAATAVDYLVERLESNVPIPPRTLRIPALFPEIVPDL